MLLNSQGVRATRETGVFLGTLCLVNKITQTNSNGSLRTLLEFRRRTQDWQPVKPQAEDGREKPAWKSTLWLSCHVLGRAALERVRKSCMSEGV